MPLRLMMPDHLGMDVHLVMGIDYQGGAAQHDVFVRLSWEEQWSCAWGSRREEVEALEDKIRVRSMAASIKTEANFRVSFTQ